MPWADAETEAASRDAVDRSISSGVPADAIACFSRWWQLETWLRDLLYVELRSRYGHSWTDHLQGRAPGRAEGDAKNRYMASPDAGELLTYADVGDLFSLIDANWALFEPVLPPQRRWHGTADELRELRNRNAHCRRPHRDDLSRLEQVLRNLEAGAQLFYGSYARTHQVAESDDPLSQAWVVGQHPTAERLLGHARDQYDTQFRLEYSVRPWAERPEPDRVSGHEGVLIHASWVIAGRDLNAAKLWAEVARQTRASDLMVHLLVDTGHVTATFAAIDDPERIADAIGATFDLILTESHATHAVDLDIEGWERFWYAGTERLPLRLQVKTALTLVDPYEPEAFSIFGA